MIQMRRGFLVVALVAVAAVAFLGARATTGQANMNWPATKAAAVDLVVIFNEFQQTKDLNDLLTKRGEDLRKEVQEKRKALDTKAKELEAFKQDSPDYAKRFNEQMKAEIEFTAWGNFMQAQVEAEHRVWLRRTYRQVVDVVGQIATERGIDIVFYSDAPTIEGESVDSMRNNIRQRKMVWSSRQVDITEQVLQRLNRDYEKQGGRASIKLPF